ncbi:GntR family transcriptional regulator [Janibacter melonis]|uniref:GntR family transcriptional regulator n=1 Tax=Janibacter melonis TaxID=262209 RepID=UPI00191ABF1D|nr:GntR family transcriptional regulator [Janibacter melonis]
MNAKYQRVASLLREQIHVGDLSDGEKLPGEAELARDLGVSRGTVRQAIAELQRQNLVDTQMGVGSFVTFDGVALNSPLGWAQALAVGGVDLDVTILSIDLISVEEIPDAPRDIGFDEAVAVRRVRRLGDGTAVSFECASVPATGILRDLPTSGLVDGSITKTLAQAGLRATGGDQQVSLVELPAREAELLGRREGEPFLRSVRTSRSARGDVVEHVVSSLAPRHFRLHTTFGDRA